MELANHKETSLAFRRGEHSGGIALLDKAEKDFGLILSVFGGSKKVRDFESRMKLLLCNPMGQAVAVNQILDTYPQESCELLGLRTGPWRGLCTVVELVGKCYPILMVQYQDILEKHGLGDRDQLMDFSSTYFKGKADLGKYGYSRDRRPDRKQIAFGSQQG